MHYIKITTIQSIYLVLQSQHNSHNPQHHTQPLPNTPSRPRGRRKRIHYPRRSRRTRFNTRTRSSRPSRRRRHRDRRRCYQPPTPRPRRTQRQIPRPRNLSPMHTRRCSRRNPPHDPLRTLNHRTQPLKSSNRNRLRSHRGTQFRESRACSQRGRSIGGPCRAAAENGGDVG